MLSTFSNRIGLINSKVLQNASTCSPFFAFSGKRVAQTFINSIGFVLGGNVLRRKTVPFFYFVYFIGKSIFRGISGAEDPTFWWDYLKEEDTLLMPNLYIYSKGDVCVNPEHTKVIE